MIEAGLLFIGLVAGIAAAALAFRPAFRRYARTEEALKADNEAKNAQLIDLNRQAAERAARCAALEEKLLYQQAEAERERARRTEEIAALQEQQRLAFKNLANDILEEKSRQFKQSNRESLESLLKPFRENIEGFRKRVDEVYDKEAQQRFSLKEEIRSLNEMNRRMSEEANNLTRALKGNSKVQGDWGEMILETILDSSHLVKGIHYFTQENLKDAAGNNLRPDVILNLPDRKQIVVDSKVSLTAYVAYAESADPDEASRAVKNHLRSVRSHIDELGSKRYQALVDSPDFVIMFVPNEPAYLLALQADPDIWNYAYQKKVVLISPTNLIAALRLALDLWKREYQVKNIQDIIKRGTVLYEKLVGFTETFEKIGDSLQAASTAYKNALGQLSQGKGNLIRQADMLTELGITSKKRFSSRIRQEADRGTTPVTPARDLFSEPEEQ